MSEKLPSCLPVWTQEFEDGGDRSVSSGIPQATLRRVPLWYVWRCVCSTGKGLDLESLQKAINLYVGGPLASTTHSCSHLHTSAQPSLHNPECMHSCSLQSQRSALVKAELPEWPSPAVALLYSLANSKNECFTCVLMALNKRWAAQAPPVAEETSQCQLSVTNHGDFLGILRLNIMKLNLLAIVIKIHLNAGEDMRGASSVWVQEL